MTRAEKLKRICTVLGPLQYPISKVEPLEVLYASRNQAGAAVVSPAHVDTVDDGAAHEAAVDTNLPAVADGVSSGVRHGAEPGTGLWTVVAGILSGLMAGVGMGVVLSLGTTLVPLIGALYGQESF